MNRVRKEKLAKALAEYTKKVTKSQAAAKDALEKEGIYLSDGKLAPQYKEAAAS